MLMATLYDEHLAIVIDCNVNVGHIVPGHIEAISVRLGLYDFIRRKRSHFGQPPKICERIMVVIKERK